MTLEIMDWFVSLYIESLIVWNSRERSPFESHCWRQGKIQVFIFYNT